MDKSQEQAIIEEVISYLIDHKRFYNPSMLKNMIKDLNYVYETSIEEFRKKQIDKKRYKQNSMFIAAIDLYIDKYMKGEISLEEYSRVYNFFDKVF